MENQPSSEHHPHSEAWEQWHLASSRDVKPIPDTAGLFDSPYSSYAACITAIVEKIKGTQLGFYQDCKVNETYVEVSTSITHPSEAYGVLFTIAHVAIPIDKKTAIGIASALGWARRLSLVQAFNLGDATLPLEERIALQQSKQQLIEASRAPVIDEVVL